MDYCPRCYRVGDDIGNCGNFKLGCPRSVKVDPSKVAIVRCANPCNVTRAVPVGNIMKGKITTLKGTCKSDICKAIVITPAAPPTKAAGHGSKTQKG